MSRQRAEQITPTQLQQLDAQAPGLADYIKARRHRGVPTLGKRWHRGS